jgi:protein SCO1/2
LGKVTSYGKPALGGPWTLVDFTGKPVTDADFRGEFLLLYFGFTHCPDICPSELVKVGRILDLLDKEQSLPMVRPVFISVDPDRDNVGQLRHYAQGASWVLAFKKKQRVRGRRVSGEEGDAD